MALPLSASHAENATAVFGVCRYCAFVALVYGWARAHQAAPACKTYTVVSVLQAPYDTSYPPGFAQPAVASEHHLGPHYSAPPSSRQLEMATAPAQVATLFGHPPESARGTATSFAVPVGQHVPPVAMPAVMPYNMPAAMPATFDHFHGPNSGRV